MWRRRETIQPVPIFRALDAVTHERRRRTMHAATAMIDVLVVAQADEHVEVEELSSFDYLTG